MKKLSIILSIVIILINCISEISYAQNTNDDKWNDGLERTINVSLSTEENKLYIYSEKEWNDVSLQLISTIGFTIYMDIINIPSKEETTILLPEINAGNYQVVLSKNNSPKTWFLTE